MMQLNRKQHYAFTSYIQLRQKWMLYWYHHDSFHNFSTFTHTFYHSHQQRYF